MKRHLSNEPYQPPIEYTIAIHISAVNKPALIIQFNDEAKNHHRIYDHITRLFSELKPINPNDSRMIEAFWLEFDIEDRYDYGNMFYYETHPSLLWLKIHNDKNLYDIVEYNFIDRTFFDRYISKIQRLVGYIKRIEHGFNSCDSTHLSISCHAEYKKRLYELKTIIEIITETELLIKVDYIHELYYRVKELETIERKHQLHDLIWEKGDLYHTANSIIDVEFSVCTPIRHTIMFFCDKVIAGNSILTN